MFALKKWSESMVFCSLSQSPVGCLRAVAIRTTQNDRNAPLQPESVLQQVTSGVCAVVISPDNKWIATGSIDNTIKIWETETGRELGR